MGQKVDHRNRELDDISTENQIILTPPVIPHACCARPKLERDLSPLLILIRSAVNKKLRRSAGRRKLYKIRGLPWVRRRPG